MTIKQFISVCCLSIMTFASNAKTVNSQIQVRSELSNPIMLENNQEKNYLKISLTGIELDSSQRSPINLALVIDRSTSMSGERIEKAREAAILAINMLEPYDTISVVAYDSRAEILIPATKVTNKTALIKIINDKVHPQGMTALFAGLTKGINQLDKYLDKERVNRVILLSDGQANVGPTSIGELSELSKIAARKGIAITTIGIGSGYNENLMVAIAGYSDGNHSFVNNSADLENAFVREFKDVMSVVAQEVNITINVSHGVKPVRLLGREGEISGNVVNIKMNQLYSNQEKYVLLEVIPEKGKDNEEKTLASVMVNYDNLVSKQSEKLTEIVKVQYSKSKEVVQDAVMEDVIVDTEIQQMVIENEKALELYNQGKVSEAREKMTSNSQRLSQLSEVLQSAPLAAKVRQQAESNQIMTEAIESKDETIFKKEFAESQYDLKQNIQK